MSTHTEDFLASEPCLGEADVWLPAAGKHPRPLEKLGAHPCVRVAAAAESVPCHGQTAYWVLSLRSSSTLWLEPGTDS